MIISKESSKNESSLLNESKDYIVKNKGLRNLTQRFYYLIPIILISSIYVLIILVFSHGRLFFGGDYVGFYNLNDFQSLNANSYIWAFSYIISNGNVYATFYVHLLISTIAAAISFYYLSVNVFNSFGWKDETIYGYVSVLLFMINPWLIQNTFMNLIIGMNITWFNLFLLGIFLSLNSKTNIRLKKYSPIIAGFGLGLSLPIFPNYFRILIVGLLVIILYAVISLIKGIKYDIKKNLFASLKFSLITVGVAFLTSLENFIPFIASYKNYISTASSGAADKVYLGFYVGGFNSILNTLRGLNSWQFPGIFYYKIYEEFSLFYIITFLWPVLALVAPVLISKNEEKLKPLFISSMLLLIIFWDKGGNPPFGSIWYSINSHIPFGYQFLPTGFLSNLFLNRFYPIMIAYFIILFFDKLKSRKTSFDLQKPKKIIINKIKKSFPYVTIIIVIFLLISAALPFFNGYAENTAYNGGKQQGGFYVPQSYFEMRDYMLSTINYNSNVLLLPPNGFNPYIVTSWNYTGEIAFYTNFFSPIKIITSNNFGGPYINYRGFENYTNLTAPTLSSLKISQVNLSNYVRLLNKYNISYFLIDSSIIAGNYSSFNSSFSIIKYLIQKNFAKIIFSAKPLTIVKIINYNVHNYTDQEITNEELHTNASGENNNFKINIIDMNASINNNQGIIDQGNSVNISLEGGNISSYSISWLINGSKFGSGLSIIRSFTSVGIYNITALIGGDNLSQSISTILEVNPKIIPSINVQTLVPVGERIYFSGGVSGGTVFTWWSYNWAWFLDGVYLKKVGDSSFNIPFYFNRTGTYNLRLVVHDGLGENASTCINITVIPHFVYYLWNNLTPGSIFYFIIVGFIFAEIIQFLSYTQRIPKKENSLQYTA
ncbi:MAG: hypothetical protein ACP5U0_09050 [Caldisphaera sp.]